MAFCAATAATAQVAVPLPLCSLQNRCLPSYQPAAPPVGGWSAVLPLSSCSRFQHTNIGTPTCPLALLLQVCRALKDRGHLDQVWGHTMYHRDDLPFDPKTMKDTFTPVKQQVGHATAV